MSSKSLVVLLAASVCLAAGTALAQTEEPEPKQETEETRSFRLQRDSSTAAAELELEDEESFHRWVPAIKQGTLEFSFALGFMNLNTTLLQHDQIVYKYTQEDTYFGDVEIKGKSSFNPVLRGGVNVSRWFALEAVGGLSFGDYESTVENRVKQKNEAGAPLVDAGPLGEFDAEKRSLLTGQLGVNAVVYPLNIKNERISRFHPYVTGGVGGFWYSMNSNYVDGPASSFDTNVGGGVRVLGDRNISVRFEVLMHFHTLEWDPPVYFTERDEATVQVPLENSAREQITRYDSNSMAVLNWSVGIQGSF
jgi:hypothetical protein